MTRGRKVVPPRFAAWLVERTVEARDRGDVLGDLQERFEGLLHLGGPLRARRWYWRQAIGFVFLWAWDRVSTTGKGAGAMRGIVGDIRTVLRGLGRAPGFTLAVILTLGLSIGGNTAMFSVVDGILLRPLPYPQPDRLFAMHVTLREDAWWSTSPADVLEWRARSTDIETIAWGQPTQMTLIAAGEPEELDVLLASANLLDVLGVSPALGAGFAPSANHRGRAATVLLTHSFWRNRLGGDPAVIGTTLDLDGEPRTVVGVVPEGLEPTFLGEHQLIAPYLLREDAATNRGRVLRAVARLQDGASPALAQEQMDRVALEVDRVLSPTSAAGGWGVRLVPLRDQIVGEVQRPLVFLLVAVLFVFLVACANVGHLLLARGLARRPEFALRSALGAGRTLIARRLLLEAGTLAALGGLVGLLLGALAVEVLPSLGLPDLPRFGGVSVDARVLTFAGVTVAVATLLSALVPTVLVSSVEPAKSFGARGQAAGFGRRIARTRDALVAGEVAVVMVLLAGTGLMLRSFDNVRAVSPGFGVEGRIVVDLTAPPTVASSSAELSAYVEELLDALSAAPGVEVAGAIGNLPLATTGFTGYHIVESLPPSEPGQEPVGGFEFVSAGYFEAMGIPLLDGRTFDTRDGPDGLPVAVVDGTMARKFWPDRSPLGDRIRYGAGGGFAWVEVVGIVGAVRYDLEAEARPMVYVPQGQTAIAGFRRRSIVVKTDPGLVASLIPTIPRIISSAGRGQAVSSVRTMANVSSVATARRRFQTLLVAGFGLVALLLALTGISGLVAYNVSQRLTELGVRVALGAPRRGVLSLVLRRGLTPVAVGMALGTAGALVLSQAMSDLLYELDSADPAVLVLITVLVGATGFLATLLPGLRALRLDPVTALRAQ